MRAFVAVDLSEPVRAQIKRLAPGIRGSGIAGRLVRPESVHLTLRFLGEIRDPQVADVRTAMEAAAKRCECFSMHVRGLGVFSHLERPCILWAGVTPQTEIGQLQAALEGQLTELGFAPARKPYHPHLTIARLKAVRDQHSFEKFLQLNRKVPFGQIRVNEILLFQSLLKPHGAEYNVVGRATLR